MTRFWQWVADRPQVKALCAQSMQRAYRDGYQHAVETDLEEIRGDFVQHLRGELKYRPADLTFTITQQAWFGAVAEITAKWLKKQGETEEADDGETYQSE